LDRPLIVQPAPGVPKIVELPRREETVTVAAASD